MQLSKLFKEIGEVRVSLKIDALKESRLSIRERLVPVLYQIQNIAEDFPNRNYRDTGININKRLYRIANKVMSVYDGLAERPYISRKKTAKILFEARKECTGLRESIYNFIPVSERVEQKKENEKKVTKARQQVIHNLHDLDDYKNKLEEVIPEKPDDEGPLLSEFQEREMVKLEKDLSKWQKFKEKLPDEPNDTLNYSVLKMPIMVFLETWVDKSVFENVNFEVKSLAGSYVFEDQVVLMFDKQIYNSAKWNRKLRKILETLKEKTGHSYIDMLQGETFYSPTNRMSYSWLLNNSEFKKFKRSISIAKVAFPFDSYYKPQVTFTSNNITELRKQADLEISRLNEPLEKEFNLKEEDLKVNINAINAALEKLKIPSSFIPKNLLPEDFEAPYKNSHIDYITQVLALIDSKIKERTATWKKNYIIRKSHDVGALLESIGGNRNPENINDNKGGEIGNLISMRNEINEKLEFIKKIAESIKALRSLKNELRAKMQENIENTLSLYRNKFLKRA